MKNIHALSALYAVKIFKGKKPVANCFIDFCGELVNSFSKDLFGVIFKAELKLLFV